MERIEINGLAVSKRKELNENSFSPIDVFALISSMPNTSLVFYAMPKNISGLCIKDGENVVIAINSDTSLGRQRFTAAHELYHVWFNDDLTTTICDMSLNEDNRAEENDADNFASYFLMPYEALREYAKTKKINEWMLENVIECEQFFKLSHEAMLSRLSIDKQIRFEDKDKYRVEEISSEAEKLGFTIELYSRSPEKNKYFAVGDYIRKVELLAKSGKISDGKKNELLMDGFRADMVYGIEDEGIVNND
ncbi:MAG: ImmA/IrrE family metallo-endopeptidase [Eubacteriaceae bacterium]|nr:ImmA/IrrE family metallo-endopeptidase [Eubacteriaceae bacterium]